MSKQRITDRHRVPCKIVSVVGPEREDHGIMTVTIFVGGPDGGWQQGFGNLAFKDKAQATRFLDAVLKTFDVGSRDGLFGRAAFALYSFGTFSETIEGLEDAASGRRFTITGWNRKIDPKTPSRLEHKRTTLTESIAMWRRRIAEVTQEIETLPLNYVDWERADLKVVK